MPQKRIDLLVTWHQDVPADLDLVLIGQDDGELERIRTQVSTLGLTKRIHILPSLPADDVIASYAQAEMLVMASRNEGLPTVILEAMVKDVPVVVPNVGGIPFIVKSGVSGWIYPGGNRRAISRACGWPCRIERHGRESQRRICTKTSPGSAMRRTCWRSINRCCNALLFTPLSPRRRSSRILVPD